MLRCSHIIFRCFCYKSEYTWKYSVFCNKPLCNWLSTFKNKSFNSYTKSFSNLVQCFRSGLVRIDSALASEWQLHTSDLSSRSYSQTPWVQTSSFYDSSLLFVLSDIIIFLLNYILRFSWWLGWWFKGFYIFNKNTVKCK